jgi:type IV pilus assembly protein PilQ
MSFLKALPAAALLFLPSSVATVHSLSVVPSSGKTEVVIGVNAAVDVQDFTLDAPARVVVDLKGATLDMSRSTYDKVARGGITNIRYSQFRPNVVRVVIEMDAKHPYAVKRNNGEVRVAVTGGKTEDYTSWSSNPSKSSYAAAPRQLPPTRPAATRAVAQTAEVSSPSAQVVSQIESNSSQAETPDYAAPVEPVALRTSTSAKPVALFSQAQQSQQAPLTVTFQDTDIRDVIASFAAFSGRTIVVGKDVTGTVTAEIRNQPWDVALRAILQGQ